MTARAATASAPGKVILFGEHAVGRGRPAVAVPLDRTLALTATLRHCPAGARTAGAPADPRLGAAIALAAGGFGLDPDEVAVHVDSEVPAGCGLGSSAALSTALLRALADLTGRRLGRDELWERATAVEAAFHGTSSGLDVAAVVLDVPVWFDPAARPRAVPLAVGRDLALVVAATGDRRSTADQIRRVRRYENDRPDTARHAFRRLGALAAAGRDTLRAGDLPALGVLLDEAHAQLAGLGLSTPALDRARAAARAAGALGAKLTGAGGGGAIVALAPDAPQAVVRALRAAGFEAFTTRIRATR
ncbi:mevalonate kinase [Kitasatospora sp. NPDC004531]